MNDGVETFDLTSQEIDILNGQNPADFTVSFYETQLESTSGVSPIVNPTAYINTASPSQTIYVRVDNNSNPTCFAETTFDIIVNPFPIVDSSPDINVCDSYVLPTLAPNNFYYTAIDGPNGSGSIVNEGTVITTSTTLFVYVVTGIAPNECFDQKSFNITINTSPVADAPTDVQACETYTLPTLSPNNFYYTATGGPTGSGTLVAEGTVITTTTTLYVYSENGITPNNCSDENVFTITINPFPVADAPSDVNACDNYTLPTLSTNNNYYTAAGGPNGSGTLVADGTVITTSSVLYVYSEIGTAPNMCSDENLFNITINTSPVADAPTDVQACETYTLPTLSADNFYYTATGGSNGSGTIIGEGTVITTTTTLYVYTENGVAPNDCSDENTFTVTINPFPVADAPIDVNACDNYILPVLSANNFYYTETGGPNGSGTIVVEGTVISTSSTLYVYTEIGMAPNMCSDENMFNITINASPVADAPSDVEVCDTYTLPILSPDNFYYTATGGPNGSGTMLPEGSDITSTTTLYVFTESGVTPNNCSDESTFIITINTSPVADAPADVQACDSYILPILSTDNFYYTATGGPSGSGTIIAEGTVINSSTILYVFTENGVSPNICSDENMLTITIDDTPVADAPVDVQACDSYILPNLSPNNFYYTATGGSNGTGLLVPEGTAITTTTTMYVFSETATSPNNCTDENVFNITIDVSPTADAPADVQSCDSYFLPNLSPDNYYYTATGGPNGSGNIVAPGTEITNSTTLYVYTELGSTPNNCTDENSFQVTVNTTPTADAPIDVQVCDTYVLPQLSANNNYYTATGGPSGTGTLLNQGDVITSSTTLFVYSQTGTGPNFCIDENNFDIIINTSPIADNPSDAQSCDMYVLPVLSPNNFYYSQTGGPNGTGVMLAAGDTITMSTTLYIYTESGVDPYKCSDENIFNITIDVTPVADSPANVQSCDTYVLPQLSINNAYYTATGGPNGVGNLVAEGTSITTTTTLYVYSETATSPNNCFDENSFIVTIDYSPVADDPMDVQACDSYILPTLSPNNNYYTETDGPYGTGNMITAGTEIFATTTLYVFSEALTSPNNCKDENSFIVNVNTSPTVNPVDDMIICENDFDNSEAFDLTSNDDIIINNQTDTMVTYHNSLIDAQLGNAAINNPESYQNVSNPETIYIRLENQLTGCYDVGDFDLIVNNSGALLSTTSLTFCDPDSDGFGVFTLTDAEQAIIGGAPGIDLSYHETLSDAQLNVNALTSPYYNIVENNQTIYVSINNYNNDCSSVVFLNLIVYPTPQITDPSPLEVCDNDTDGIAVFDLELNNAEILNQLDSDTSNDLATADYTITFYETLANAEVPQNAIATPNAYVNTTPDLQTIWVRVDDNANGCSTVTTMDLVVNPLPVLVQPDALELCNATDLPGETSALAQEEFTLEEANAQILNGQSGITLTYYFTQSGADTATAADQIFSPYTNVANAQTVYIRAEDNVTNCVSTITLDLRVNPTPSPQATPATLVVCDDDNDGFSSFDLDSQTTTILNGEPDVTISYHETESDAINDINVLISPYTNIVANTQMVYVRAENDNTGCFTIVILPLDVQPSPVVPVAIDDYVVCDDNDDGFNQFDFDTVMTPQILGTQNPSDFTLTYHTTQANAETGSSPIVNTGNYTNATNPQTIYIRLVSNTNGCVSTGEFIISVEFPPVIVQPTPLTICDELDANYYENNDEIATFDLTVKNDEITAGDTSWIVTYYETQADATADSNAITDPTQYTNMMVGTNPANPQTVYVRVTDGDTGCFSFTTLTIRVLPNPTPAPNPDNIVLCDDVDVVGPNDLIEIFDLTTNEVATINGEANVSASYYTDLDDALMGSNQIVDPTMHSNEDPNNPGVAITPQTIYVRVTNGSDALGTGGTGCFTIVSFDIMVNPLPAVVPISDYIYCELFNDGQYGFDLESKTDEILNGQDPTLFTVTYHETQAEADQSMNDLVSPYTNTSNPQTIYVNITNTITGCDTTTTFVIEVQEAAQVNPDMESLDYSECDDNMETDGDTTNDSVQFDLESLNEEVLDGQDPLSYIVSYYESQSDADAGINPLPLLYENIVNPQVIYVRVDNDTMVDDGTGTMVDSSICYDTAEITLRVNPLPEFDLEDSYLLCINTNGSEVVSAPIIDTGLDETQYTFEWSLDGLSLSGETGSSLEPTQAGTYEVIVTNVTTTCNNSDTTIVEESEPPTVTYELLTEAFADVHNIEVTATGNGTVALYEFSLDDGPWESNIPNNGSFTFTDVGAGDHIITVRDINGCGERSVPVSIMDYPHFFTPNDDGFNDTWNIYGIGNQPDAVIYIFDRYGKLIKQLSPTGSGWDGTYNGNPMPTSDYWFTVDYKEQNDTSNTRKQFKAHFTLKR
ncbi:gliding motility-associated C-terminal domain-containing protein [Olleya aquimaris]|nr:gliding motility-associated C-terminal domain-containing protein [Olleya aquimaris]